MADHRARFPHWQTHALKFATWTLGIVGLKLLMGFDEDSFYGAQFEALLRSLLARFTAADIEAALRDHPLQNEYVRATLKARFQMARPFLDDRYPSLRSYLRPPTDGPFRQELTNLRSGGRRAGRARFPVDSEKSPQVDLRQSQHLCQRRSAVLLQQIGKAAAISCLVGLHA